MTSKHCTSTAHESVHMAPHFKYQPVVDLGSEEHELTGESVSGERVSHALRSKRPSHQWLSISVLVAITAATIAGILCFLMGRYVERQSREADWFCESICPTSLASHLHSRSSLVCFCQAPPGRIDHTFNYRHQFGMRPGNESQKYWDLVFPGESDH